MTYEPNIQIFFDVIGKGATVIFRGQVFYVKGPFKNHSEAIAAGEQKCRELGWNDDISTKGQGL